MSNSFFARWDHWWCRTAPPHPLAILRIAFGFFLFIEALTYIPGVPVLFSNQGLVFSLWADAVPSALRFLLEPPSVSVAWIIFCLYVLCTLGLSAGIFMRTSLFILVLLFLYYWQLSFHFFPSSYHRLFFVVLLVLLFSGADKTLSLRMRWKHGSFFAWEPINILPQRLLSAQITATYVGVGWQKMWLPDWQNGKILYYSFLGKWGSPLAFALARVLPQWTYDVQNEVVKIFEFFLPFCLWMKQWRIPAMIGATLFHLAIAILLGIWWFLVLPPAFILFFEPEQVERFLRKKGWSGVAV